MTAAQELSAEEKAYWDYWEQDANNCGGCETCFRMFGQPPAMPAAVRERMAKAAEAAALQEEP
jgi:hypothetical protein